MNAVLVFLIILGAVWFWFLISFLFPIMGEIVKRLWDSTKDNIEEDEDIER